MLLDPPLAPLPSERGPTGPDQAAVRIVRGWAPRIGPVTARSLAGRIGLDADAAAQALVALEAEGLVLRGRFLDGEPWSAEAPHFCERTVLARIHRLTLGRLRREIEPVSTADFLRFLLRWQHLAPGTQLHGARGLAEVVGQLQGFHAAAGAWEGGLLAARVGDYQPALLDVLCLSGEVAWGRLSLHPERTELEPAARPRTPTRAAPVTLAHREDLGWLLAASSAPGAEAPEDALPAVARELAAVLRARGASFPAELALATRRPRADVEEGLGTLVGAGLATCDGFEGLRSLTRRGGKHRAAGGGRWSLLRAGIATGAGDPAERGDPSLVERLAQQVLRRYGVVFRELLSREDAPPWRELVRVLRTLEARGSVRGGRFVEGRSGEQFALPEAVDALRAVRRMPRQGAERVELPAADPLNLVGILTPGPRVPAQLAGTVVYVDGVPAAVTAPAIRPAGAALEAGTAPSFS